MFLLCSSSKFGVHVEASAGLALGTLFNAILLLSVGWQAVATCMADFASGCAPCSDCIMTGHKLHNLSLLCISLCLPYGARSHQVFRERGGRMRMGRI